MKASKSRSLILLGLFVPVVVLAQGGQGELIVAPSVSEPTRQDNIGVLAVAEEAPEFPGGDKALFAYMKKELKYPEQAKAEGIEGKVFLSFIVELDGSLSGIRVLRAVNPWLDSEAVRMVKSMPKWIPGKQNGQPCRVQMNLPVTFKLTD